MKPIINLLQEFDFTESEAKVYLACLENGASTGYEISKLSGVARSKIYNIMETLLQKGALVCSQEEKSTLYQAVPIEQLVSALRRQIEINLSCLEQEGAKLTKTRNDDRIWYLHDWESAKSRCLQMITDAREEVMMQIWSNELDGEFERCIRYKQEKLDRVAVILYDETETYHTSISRFYKHGFERDKLNELGGRWLTISVDGKEMIYITFSGAVMAQAICSKNPDIVLFAREYMYHDAYCLRLIDHLRDQAASEFGFDLEGVRNVFS
jgi:Predicted transcriptional regulators